MRPCGIAAQVRKLYAPCHVAARTRWIEERRGVETVINNCDAPIRKPLHLLHKKARENPFQNAKSPCKIDIAPDEQSSPDQRTDITKNNTKLVSKGLLGISIHPGSLQS